MKELLNKLSKAKAEITPIVKNETNPFFKSKYCDINALLAEIEPILHAHNLLLLQPIENNTVATKIYDIESGQVIESSMTLPDLQDPQKMGSVVTYYRRYTCVSLLGLQAIDNDGNLTPPPKTRNVSADIAKGLLQKMKGLKTLAELQSTYKALSPELQKNAEIIELTKQLKTKLK